VPGAGFYAISCAKLKFGSDGRWYVDGEPIVHERLALLFSRYLRRKPGGGFEIWIDERYHADVEVEDTPYVVTGVGPASSPGSAGFTLRLSDGSSEPLDPDSLQVGAGNVLYCRVKSGSERARFLRHTYYQLAHFIEEAGDGQFRLRCGHTTHAITQL
jgi:hypothetical protein